MKILHVISGDLWAGAEVMASHLLKHLLAFPDLDLTVLLLNESRLAMELRSAGLKVQVMAEHHHSFPQIAVALQKILAPNPPDIVHSHRYKENILAFLATRFYPGVSLIATQHGLPETRNYFVPWTRRHTSKINFLLMSRYFRKVVAVSEDIRTFLVNELSYCAERVTVIRNGINIPPIVFSKVTDGSFVIGSSGRLFPVKDYPLMVRVALELATKKEICMALAGDGPEMGALKILIDEYGLAGKFYLKGHLEDMDSFYSGLDIYLNTSVHEGIPMTILEAMAHGLPVIAPDVGGIGEIIEDGIEGFLVSTRDPKAFAEKCLLLQDVELRQRMGQAARAKVERGFSAEHMALQYYQLYRGLAG